MFPGYSKAEELSRGNQGIVYRAIQDGTHRKVAIKLPLYAGRMSEVKRRRFFREIELIALISHPNIVQIFHSGVTSDGAPFYVMDFVDGVPLDQYVREKNLSIEHLLELMRDICLAMDHAHQQSVVHRDLKPSNILVEPDGKPTIVDFGLAKLFEADREALLAMKDDAITGKQDVIGTMRYMSPEHARGTPEKIEPRSDVYSLGVILYEQLTGQLPYPEVAKTADVLKYMDEFLRHVIETPAELPRKKWESGSGIGSRTADGSRATKCPIDSELETIVLCALAKEVGRRYQSARAMAEDIRRYLIGEPIVAQAPSVFYGLYVKGRQQIRKHRILSHALAIILSAVTTFMFVKYVLFERTGLQRTVMSALFELHDRNSSIDRYEHVTTATFGKDFTNDELANLAAELELSGFNPGDSTVRRLFFGRLFENLASVPNEARCKAVVLDFKLGLESTYDPAFLRGVEQLRACDIPVIVGVRWALDDNGTQLISPALKDKVRYGAPDISSGEKNWIVYLGMQRGGNRVYPSLVLETYATVTHPHARAWYEILEGLNIVEIEYWDESTFTKVKELLQVSQIGASERQMITPEIMLGDVEIGYYVSLPDEEFRKSHTIDVVNLLRGDRAALESVADRILVVGTERESDNDYFSFKNKPVAGVHGIAAGIEALIQNKPVRIPTSPETTFICLAASTCGAFLGLLSLGRVKKTIWVCLSAGGVLVLCLLAFGQWNVYINPILPTLIMLAGLLTSVLVRRTYVMPS